MKKMLVKLKERVMIQWFKKLFQIVRCYHGDISRLRLENDRLVKEVVELTNVIKERTTIAVDVGYKGRSEVIVIGHYQGRDFIKSYNIRDNDFIGLVKQLKQMQKYGEIRYVDEMRGFMSVSDVMEKL